MNQKHGASTHDPSSEVVVVSDENVESPPSAESTSDSSTSSSTDWPAVNAGGIRKQWKCLLHTRREQYLAQSWGHNAVQYCAALISIGSTAITIHHSPPHTSGVSILPEQPPRPAPSDPRQYRTCSPSRGPNFHCRPIPTCCECMQQ